MLNREKYAKEIFEIACEGSRVAVVDGKPRKCKGLSCHDCDFVNSCADCENQIEKWANSEYVEPPVDWSKVPVDTPILVKPREESEWIERHFAKFENGEVYVWDNGTTSWTADPEYITHWGYARLPESEE